MDAPNLIFIIPRVKNLMRYLGKTSFIFPVREHGLSEVPIRDYTSFQWDSISPNTFRVTAYNIKFEEKNDIVEIDVPLKGRPLETFFNMLNRDAYKKAEKEYLEEQVINYLNNKLKEIE